MIDGRDRTRVLVGIGALLGTLAFGLPGRLCAQQSARIQVSATVVQIPVSETQIRDAERAVVGQIQALTLGANSTEVQGLSAAVGPVGVELSSGARLRLDPPAVSASSAVPPADRINQVTLAYLAN
jgi:hypothetical protein